jgi:hypothetical protein
MIRHEKGKWVLYTRDGKRKLGTHDTKAQAVRQEQAILAAQARRGLKKLAVLLRDLAGKLRDRFTR